LFLKQPGLFLYVFLIKCLKILAKQFFLNAISTESAKLKGWTLVEPTVFQQVHHTGLILNGPDSNGPANLK